MNQKQQIVVIHGGVTFEGTEAYLNFLRALDIDLERLRTRRDWKDTLQQELGESFDVLQPRMPNGTNAQYDEWKIMFEKVMEKVDDGVVLLGHSLGGIFLAKYLSENTPSKSIRALLLVAAPFDDESDGSLGSFALDPDGIGKITDKVGAIFLYHSKDDLVVPFAEAGKYAKRLLYATTRVFEDRGHFNQEDFSELVADMR